MVSGLATVAATKHHAGDLIDVAGEPARLLTGDVTPLGLYSRTP